MSRLSADSALAGFGQKWASRRLDKTSSALDLSTAWERFLEYSALDPYTVERVAEVRKERPDLLREWWVDAALELCRELDSEFTVALEDAMRDRFHLALVVLRKQNGL